MPNPLPRHQQCLLKKSIRWIIWESDFDWWHFLIRNFIILPNFVELKLIFPFELFEYQELGYAQVPAGTGPVNDPGRYQQVRVENFTSISSLLLFIFFTLEDFAYFCLIGCSGVSGMDVEE